MIFRLSLSFTRALLLTGFLVASSAVLPATVQWAHAGPVHGAPPKGWVAHPPFHVAPYRSIDHRPSSHGKITNPNPQGYIPCDLSNAYYLGSVNGNGAGQLIAIVDAYAQPAITSDLATFDTTFGLPAPPSFKIYQQVGTRGNQGWGLEESLDVEWAHAIAPGASIALVEAASASLSNLLNAVHYAVSTLHASVVSMSWGAVSSLVSYPTTPSFLPAAASCSLHPLVTTAAA
jgi:subtilase family serine protease